MKDFTNFAEKFGYQVELMRSTIEKYDIIVPKKQFILRVDWQYALSKFQHSADLKFCEEYIYQHYPEMKKATKKYLHGAWGYFCNQYIMKKEIFDEYCSWLFEILEAHEKFAPYENANVQTMRVSGYLAERLFGIYLTFLKQKEKIKIKELSRVFIKNPTKK